MELIKFVSSMDGIFKLLHIEVARKATDGKKINGEIFGSFTVCKTGKRK